MYSLTISKKNRLFLELGISTFEKKKGRTISPKRKLDKTGKISLEN
jgi:hypothetical protein